MPNPNGGERASGPGKAASNGVLPRTTITDLALEAIRDRILRGAYPEGAPLRQDALAAELGVSRIPVREALRQLEVEGLVTFRPHIGAVVSSLALNEIQEVFDVRAMLETDLLRRAMPALTETELGRAAEILDEFDAALAAGDEGAWGRLNWEFHTALLEPADRPLSLQILQHLRYQSDRYATLHISLMHAHTLAQREHRALLEVVRSGDVEQACALLTRHIMDAGKSLIDYLRVQRAAAGEAGTP